MSFISYKTDTTERRVGILDSRYEGVGRVTPKTNLKRATLVF